VAREPCDPSLPDSHLRSDALPTLACSAGCAR
jgi:hypothetical protein